MTFTQESLGFRRTGFSPVFSLLMPASSLPLPPRPLTGTPSSVHGTLPYHVAHPQVIHIRGFGGELQPRYILGAEVLDQ
jgi:hypothetical protein